MRKDGEFLSTLSRGLTVLRAFSRETPEMTLSEVAAKTDLSPAVARRCLNTLVDLGYVGKKDKLFLLTAEVLGFASAFIESMNLEQIVQPHLQVLRDKTGDSTSMAVLSDQDILYLVHVSTHRMVRVAAGFGTRFPAHPTSMGRVLIAHQPRELVEAYLQNSEFQQFTSKTVVSRPQLRKLIEKVKQEGFASVEDELDYGIVSVAVPIFDQAGTILAAINCSTVTTRVDREQMVQSRLLVLQETAQKIEMALRRYPVLVDSILSSAAVSRS
jgi:IclR family transcriptional regulator, pca regulon regulatory protein